MQCFCDYMFYETKLSLLAKWCGQASIFYMWVKYKPSHMNGRAALLYRTLKSWTLYIIYSISPVKPNRKKLRSWLIIGIVQCFCEHEMFPMKCHNVSKTPFMARCTRYNIMRYSYQWLVEGRWFSYYGINTGI
jgi:hypothetical protein